MKKYIIVFLLFNCFSAIAQEELQQIQQVLSEEDPEKVVWSLQDCIRYAEENNLAVLDARLDNNSAEVNYRQSKLERLPNLSGGVSQTFTNGYSIDPITSAYVNEQIHSTSTALNTSVTLFQGNQLNKQISQNKLIVDQSSLYVAEAKNSVRLRITEAYLQVLYNKEAIQVAQNTLVASEKEAETAKARYDAGAIARRDYSEALSQVASKEYNLVEARNSYSAQLLVLKQLLELEPETAFEIEAPDPEYDGYSLLEDKMEIYRDALNNLPEVEASRINVNIYEKDLEIAKGGYWPSLTLTGSIGSGYTSLQEMDVFDQFDLNLNQRIGLSLNIPIFNNGQTKAQVQNAKINIEKAKIALKTEEKELYENVDTAWRNYIAAQEQLTAAEAAREASKDAYELAQKQYEVGSINTTDLVISQNNYTNTEQNYLQAKYLGILYAQLLKFYQGKEINYNENEN